VTWWYARLADLVVVVHAAFVAFVVAGGLLVWRRPRLAWIHLPCAAWGVYIEWSGGICPLTPLEQSLRRAAGAGGYEGGFIEHYLEPILYPPGLGRGTQLVLGGLALAMNLAVYGLLLRRHARAGAATPPRTPGGPREAP
jgi:hypothetical protein